MTGDELEIIVTMVDLLLELEVAVDSGPPD